MLAMNRLLILTVAITLMPLLAILAMGFFSPQDVALVEPLAVPVSDDCYEQMRGLQIFTILEMVSCLFAVATGVFSIIHYRLKLDVTTPIIGTALFFAGMFDLFNILAANHLTFIVEDDQRFIPFTWFVARVFSLLILVLGLVPFLFQQKPIFIHSKKREGYYLAFLGILFSIASYSVIWLFGQVIEIPQAIFPENLFVRPYDAIPLILMILLAGMVIPRYEKLFPSIFAQSLLLAMLPSIASECHLLFGASELYNVHFYAGSILKGVAYLLPASGLAIDYVRTYDSERVLLETQGKLNAAREIQQSLLPDHPPQTSQYDVSGCSSSSEAVGGDYFDYLPLSEKRWLIAIADVSGHDLGASLMMAQTRAYLRSLVNLDLSLSEIINRLNVQLSNDMHGRRFITFAAFLLEDRQDATSIEYLTAGHPCYLVQANGNLQELNESQVPLGIDENTVYRTSKMEPIQPLETIVMVTDGLHETTDPSGEQYGLERMTSVVHAHQQSKSEEMIKQLFFELNQYRRQKPLIDDVTLVVIRRK